MSTSLKPLAVGDILLYDEGGPERIADHLVLFGGGAQFKSEFGVVLELGDHGDFDVVDGHEHDDDSVPLQLTVVSL